MSRWNHSFKARGWWGPWFGVGSAVAAFFREAAIRLRRVGDAVAPAEPCVAPQPALASTLEESEARLESYARSVLSTEGAPDLSK